MQQEAEVAAGSLREAHVREAAEHGGKLRLLEEQLRNAREEAARQARQREAGEAREGV